MLILIDSFRPFDANFPTRATPNRSLQDNLTPRCKPRELWPARPVAGGNSPFDRTVCSAAFRGSWIAGTVGYREQPVDILSNGPGQPND